MTALRALIRPRRSGVDYRYIMSDGVFAQFETSFILNDPRYKELSPFQRALYVGLWTFAVDRRRERLRFHNGAVSVASGVSLDPRSVPQALAKLRKLELIGWDGKEWLTVYGVKSKHTRLKDWKDDLKDFKNNSFPMREEKNREEKNRKEEEPQASLISEIITDLNSVIGKKFKTTTESYRKAIKARLAEGYQLEDFKHVHRVKAKEWIGTDMAVHLNPDTLYRPGKFAKYANQEEVDNINLISQAGKKTYLAGMELIKEMEEENGK